MSRMSKKLINKLAVFLFCLTLSFYLIIQSPSQSSEKVGNFKIQNWIEDIPILTSLIERKRDVVEFDSSNGKIISISFDIKSLSEKQIHSFYREFFKEKKWKKEENRNVWETKSKSFKKKIFKIENFTNNILRINIIVENF